MPALPPIEITLSRDPRPYLNRRRVRLGLSDTDTAGYPRYQAGVTRSRYRVDDKAQVTRWLVR